MGLLQRLDRDGHHVTGRGYRLKLPLLAWVGRHYSIATDEFHYGWWLGCVLLSAERLGYGTDFVGFRFTLIWGKEPLGVNREANA